MLETIWMAILNKLYRTRWREEFFPNSCKDDQKLSHENLSLTVKLQCITHSQHHIHLPEVNWGHTIQKTEMNQYQCLVSSIIRSIKEGKCGQENHSYKIKKLYSYVVSYVNAFLCISSLILSLLGYYFPP